MSRRDPVFRGCTRPALFLGAPLIPMLLVTGVAVMVAMLALFIESWLSVAVVALWLPLFCWMRLTARVDDQRLNQVYLRLRLRAGAGGNRRFWGALTYSPLPFRRDRP
jgi:type IV secretion system protein VirB3